MNIDNSQINKYILIDTSQKPNYARLSKVSLSKFEASTKNKAFKLNKVNRKYILEKDWK